MMEAAALFVIDPRYCIDTNVIVSFLRDDEGEPYSGPAFRPQWEVIERLISSGIIVAPRRVEHELEGWEKEIPAMKGWLADHRHMFRDMTEEQLAAAKRIVNDFPDYGSSDNYVGDLEVVSLAMSAGLAVVTNERTRPNPSQRRPKIPEVCATYKVECLSVPGLLNRESPA